MRASHHKERQGETLWTQPLILLTNIFPYSGGKGGRAAFRETNYNNTMNQIIHWDCLEVMKTIPDKSIDLVLTDPPYGIWVKWKVWWGSERWFVKDFWNTDWDLKIPEREYFDEIFRISKNQIIWGGNYFLEYLKNTPCFLYWDKREWLPERTFADWEIAWTNFKSPIRIFRHKWDWFIQEDMKNKEVKHHPTQKPKELMRWCLENYSQPWDTILDCFAWSGTTWVACIEMWRNYILIEKEKEYIDIIEKRLKWTTPPLFVL